MLPTNVNAITEIEQVGLENCVILYIGSSKAYVNTAKTKIDPGNTKVVPIVKNGRTLVPVRFISECLNAEVNWNAATSTVTISYDGRTARLIPGYGSMMINNKEIQLDVPAEIIEGRTYLPLRRLVEDVFKKSIYYDRNVIIISEKYNTFNSIEDKNMVDDLIYMFENDGGTRHISAGINHVAAIKEDGTVWGWGEYEDESITIPRRVPGLKNVVEVSAGYKYTMALKSDGTVWEWGKIEGGKNSEEFNEIPTQVQGLSDIKKLSAGCGGYHLALKEDGTVWMWGNDWYNNMEKYEAGENLKPTMVRGMSDIIDISSGKDLSFAIKKDGTVLCWAGNDPGSIEKVNGLSEVVAISATYGPTLALKKDGTVWTLKHSLDEEKHYLGQKYIELNIPVQVSELSEIIAISTSWKGSVALNRDGSVYVWGGEEYYGDGSKKPYKIPELNGVVEITAGNGFFLAMKSDDSLWGTGINSSGQIGNGSFITRNVQSKTAFSTNPLQFVKPEIKDDSVYEFDEEKTKKFDDVAENLISNYESGTYEKFVQKDKMDSVLVNNGKELVNAIKPNREIILKAGQTYNLTDALTKVKNLDYYEGEDSIYESATGEYRYSYEGKNREYVGVDGKGLVFTNIENLIIRSESDEPAYIKSKDIPHELRFECSKNIVIDGINIGHKTENIELFLADSVLFYYCKNIYINNSRIFEGDSSLSLIFVDDFVMNNSVIEDCGGGVTLSDSNNVLFKNSQFKNNVYFTLFTFETVDKVVFSACEINGNVANCGFACYEISPSITGVERTKPIVVDTVIKNNEIDYLQLNIDDIYFKNTIYNDNSFFRALYKYDLK